MKQSISLLLVLLTTLVSCTYQNNDSSKTPKPTETMVKKDMEDGSQRDLKKRWLAKIHQSSPETDWRIVEHNNMLTHYKQVQKQALLKGEKEIIADGAVVGEWHELGSANQSGSVFATTYSPELDELFLISASGTIWKGDTRGQTWKAQNDLLNFDSRFLTSVGEGESFRLIASMRGAVYYSEDKGVTWEASTGIPSAGVVRISKWVHTKENNEIFVLQQANWTSEIVVYLSTDSGSTFTEVISFSTSDLNNVAISNPLHTESVYVMEQIQENKSKLYIWNRASGALELAQAESPIAWATDGRANLVGTVDGQDTLLYTYKKDKTLWSTSDEGVTWTLINSLPAEPWEVGLFISKKDPKVMYMGEVEAYKSVDAGKSWQLIHNWWEYYDDVQRKLHADIMSFSQYDDWAGNHIMLVSNHGGISRTYDEGLSFQNLGRQGLNVSQYYDVVTHPIQSSYVFAGSQDQGYQTGRIMEDDAPNNLDQVISGDYGHIIFTNSYQSMWMVYPGGTVHYYDNAFGQITSQWQLESENETVWIPPIIPHPDPTKNIVYLAGGNMSGGPGSFMIELTINEFKEIEVSQNDFNFLWGQKGTISAMAFDHFDSSIIYVATTEGGIWISLDGGESWDRKSIRVPNAHYLYGSDILPSKTTEGKLYISGTGYSNPAVIVSYDYGETWTPMDNGLPPTLSFELAANEDESLIFAATEAGPYVYIDELEEWFHMGGVTAPSQTYWSVEYLSETNRVRYGTYGRGIWDFEISEDMVAVADTESVERTLIVYPNPFTESITLDFSESEGFLTISNTSGQVIASQKCQSGETIDLQDLKQGIYYLTLVTNSKTYTREVVRM